MLQEISTNAANKTRSSKKGSGVGSSELANGDEVEQTDDGTLDDDDQRDGSEFATEDIGNLNDVSQGDHINVIPLQTFDPSLGLDVTYPPILLPDKEVEAHAELSGGVRRAARASFHASHGKLVSLFTFVSDYTRRLYAPDTQPMDANDGADEIASDGNVDPYYEARVSNTVGDVLERYLLPFVPGPYYTPYPYDEGFGSESPHTKDDWEEFHKVNLGLRKKELYKDPKVCRTALDRFPTPAETHWLREISSVELSDRMMKGCERLSKQCAQQMHTIKRQRSDLKQQNGSSVHANKEVSRLTAELGVLKSKCKATEHKLNKKAKIEEELVGTKSQLEHRERQAGRSRIALPLLSVIFHSTCSKRIAGFIPDAKEKFDRVVAAFPNTTFPFLDKVSQNSQSSLQDIARPETDRVTSSHKLSSTTASLGANTHVRRSTSSSGTFGHTSTL
ncbi:hypothetical protein Tco_0442702 [Tanacetum coccineum]